MINMITQRRGTATLVSGLFCAMFYVIYPYSPMVENMDSRGNEGSEFKLAGPVPDDDGFEGTAAEPISGKLVSVIESPSAATYTSHPIQTGYLPQLPAADQQPAQLATPTIQKPVPPDYQGAAPSPFDQPTADNDGGDQNLEVLMRGPLHEAYAEVYQHDPKPSVVISRQPPEPIDELPPEFKPAGDNVEWIPGYWAWDDERNDFIWISGVWRNIPPGQRWVPGFWQTEGEGFRWVSGFWIGDQQTQVDYLPSPPSSLDNGPVYPAPSDDHYYAPGNWVYQNNHYVWRSGYWAPRVAYRVWIPARYIWTPSGCVYRPGFWDYEFDQRGVLFAPVCFNAPVYRQVQYCYQPTYVVNTNVDFMAHLFIRPSYCHYYFGDWYGPRYMSRNFYPWSNYGYANLNFRAYDPLYSYYRCRSTRYNNVQALGWVQNQFSFYFQYQNYRPQHTYRGQRQFVRDHERDHYGNDAVRRASYGERYDDRISRQKPSDGRTRGYSKVEVTDRIESVAVSREISRRRGSQSDHFKGEGRDQRTQAKLELPKSKYTSVKRSPDRQQNSGIRIPDDLRRKFEGFEKQQAEKRTKDLSTKTRNPGPKDGSQGQAAKQPERTRPQVSRQLENQPASAAKQPESVRNESVRKGQRTQENQVRDQQRQQRNQKSAETTDQRHVQKPVEVRRQQLPNREQQDQEAVANLKRQPQPSNAALREQDRRAVDSREKQKQDENRRQAEQARQQRQSAQQAKNQRDARQHAKEAQSTKPRETQQRTQRSAQPQAIPRTEASQKMQTQRDVQQRATKEQTGNRELTQRVAKQQTDRIRAGDNRQRNPQPLAQRQREAQQQRDIQQKTQQQRDSQQQARRAQQRAQRESQQRAQRESQQRAQRESQQRAQRESQQRAQRESQQRAQRESQQRAQRDTKRQKNDSKGKKN